MSGDQLRSFGRNDIGNRIEEFGTVAEGPGNATLGRSLLALGDLQESRRHLEIAMESGFDRPEVRTALGWVLARLYRSELNEALREKDRELRPLRIEQARKNLRDPALDLLTGHLRLSSAHTAKARLQYSTGGDSSETLKRAIQAAERAVQVSPDSSDAYRVLGNARLYVAFAGEKHGIDPTLERTRAIADLEKALELEPDNVSALNSLGLIHIDTINAARDRGFDPEPAIEAGIDLFTRATALLPTYTHAHSNLGIVYRLRGEHELRQGLDPAESIARAAASYQSAIKIDPAYTFAYNNLGNVYRLAAKAKIARGEDPGTEIERALEQYTEASRRNSDWSFPYLNAGIAYRLVARYLTDHGRDAGDNLELARTNLEKGIELLGDHPLAWVELAEVELVAADNALNEDLSPEPALKATEKAVRRSLATDPDFSEAHRLTGEIEFIRARRHLQTGGSPDAVLRKARSALERSYELNDRTAATSLALARLASMEASRAGGSRADALRTEAVAHAERVLELNPGNDAARRLLNELHPNL